ncbi:MAG: YggS family pyridoxal phosphate-dependent enzyme [Bdellovibrionota bacterium]
MSQEAFDNFLKLLERACESAGRKKTEIELLPVSKGQGVAKIKEFLLLDKFPQQLAENYLAELSEKEEALPQIQWHYQGALQSRKLEEILKHASVLQSVSREKELLLVKKINPEKLKGFYLQVNISSEGQKLGASQNEVKHLLDVITKEGLDSLFLGFMGIASELGGVVSESTVREQFSSLRNFRDKVSPSSKLSMGMSSDFHLAIAEGADLVRVGSLLFGERK